MMREKINNFRAEKQARKLDAHFDYEKSHIDIEVSRPINTLRTDATEILGSSRGLLRGHYARATENINKKISKAERNVNEKSVREKYLQLRDEQTMAKIDRVQAKIDNSRDTFISRQVNNQRRQKVAALSRKRKILAYQSGNIERKRVNKPEELQKKIDAYMRKRIDAIYKKALRHEMSQQGYSRYDIIKRTEFVSRLTREERKEIAREAILLVRKNNIEAGTLSADYVVDDTLPTRKIDHYERTLE
jgi:flagellar biosynthesis GTPase FlhF